MTELEQELVLFFKLYLLAHKANYINYMEQTIDLAKWFDFTQYKKIDITQRQPIFCGNCYNLLGNVRGGAITCSCDTCKTTHNMGYELNQLSIITGIDWYYCMYLLSAAVADIYKSNSVQPFRNLIY